MKSNASPYFRIDEFSSNIVNKTCYWLQTIPLKKKANIKLNFTEKTIAKVLLIHSIPKLVKAVRMRSFIGIQEL